MLVPPLYIRVFLMIWLISYRASMRSLQNSTFVFVPGINDPWGSTVSMGSAHAWPQQPVPSRFTQKLKRVCKDVIWASNPTRLAYLSQEIVVVRDDITDRLKRHSIAFPMEELTQGIKLMEPKSDDATSISQLVEGKRPASN